LLERPFGQPFILILSTNEQLTMASQDQYHRSRVVALATFARCLLFVAVLPAGFLSATGQQSMVEQLDEYIAEAQQTWPVPGLAVAIVKDGQVVLSKGYGLRELGGSDPVDEHTLFAIASNTKAFTAAALAMLVDDGLISWDDHVSDHLPYLQLNDPLATIDLRVRDLLTHRAGFRDYSGDLVWYGTPYSAEEVLKRIRHLPAEYPFRAVYGYSNVMYIAAGEVVSNVSGRPFNQFVRDEILSPLAMTRTTLEDGDFERLGNVATPHRERDGATIPLSWFEWEAADAAGGIVSSVHDMSRWIRLQLHRGSWNDVKLFSADRSAEMWSPQTVIPVGAQTQEQYPSIHFRAYGLGWVLQDYLGQKVVMHAGGYDGMFSRVAMVPGKNLGLVVLTNAMTGVTNAITYRILDAFLGGPQRDWTAELLPGYLEDRANFSSRQRAVLEPAPGVSTEMSRQLPEYAGRFSDPMYGDAGVALETGSLVLRLLPFPDLVADLDHLHSDTFKITWRKDFAWFDGGVVQFLTDPGGNITGIRIDIPNEDFWFDELNLRRVPGSPDSE
jgi:CubicO group peptidase (beta-lactamase class C family)